MRKQVLFYWLVMVALTATVLSGCDNDLPTAQIKNSANQTQTASVNQANQITSQNPDVRVYTANTNYRSPAGTEDYSVTITTDKAGVVTDINTSSTTNHEASLAYQSLFLEGIKSQVIGKSLKDLGSVDRVNGASLTPMGYNKALEQIKTQANAV